MRTICIYHSETGNTHAVMMDLVQSIGAECIRVKDLAAYGKATMYLLGIPRAHSGALAEIEPDVIDVSGYDLIILGTPVWAFRPTPAANAMIQAMKNASGTKAILVCTSHGSPGETLAILEKMALSSGMNIVGRHNITFSRQGVKDEKEVAALKRAVWDIART